jgi:hypothetical protein
LDTGKSWHAVSVAMKVPYSTVKKHARAMGYEPPGRLVKPKILCPSEIKTGHPRLLTLQEALALARTRQNDAVRT